MNSLTLDVDANGILNVTAKDESTGRSNKITITNDKGRLSKSEIERMVAEAEKFKSEDEAQKQRISSRNALENYAFSIQGAIRDYGDKLNSSDKDLVEKEIKNTMDWLESNSLAEKEEYEHKLEELQKTCSPMMAKLHGSQGSGGSPSHHRNGPTVDEMD